VACLVAEGPSPLGTAMLNTHKLASLYEAFEPAEARRLLERLEIQYAPKHGSWLNMAETELSVLGRQCLNRRIADNRTLTRDAHLLVGMGYWRRAEGSGDRGQRRGRYGRRQAGAARLLTSVVLTIPSLIRPFNEEATALLLHHVISGLVPGHFTASQVCTPKAARGVFGLLPIPPRRRCP